MNNRKNLISGIALGAALLTLIILAIIGFRRLGTWLVKDTQVEHADAIVFLSGIIPDRVLHTADLYNAGRAEQVILVMESQGQRDIMAERGFEMIRTYQEISDALIYFGVDSSDIILLPGDAKSTQMEAEAIRDFLDSAPNHGIDSVLLVSSSPHMRRAGMIFETALGQLDPPVNVFCSPSTYTEFNAEKWWREREDIQDVVFETLKIVNFALLEKRKLKMK